ncbi:sigma-54-dependent Fis family transcriptional regulator [Desulfohalobiaceae bacterium Ax17]|uniref:sigma-54-dependent transcriptional regulator n=1 Tax=Desulfovulcanus ferrireducens TaxID=2831190 RepID=UPI00207BB7BB|nr:sigma-54 dependent transcriptional regulator [Desulfovulcanus ferrireducens]MBT8763999.1 sigma-54-dependent Fis family transcriptional regulator [Desulfovulcanus ferrireducens]
MAKILIVDDDPQLRQSFARLLSDEGYHVIAASSAEKGLELVKNEFFDLAILDLRLPGMNGIEGFKALKRISPKLPVVIMTAYGSTETAIEATKLGAFDYVLKPFDIPEFLSLIRKGIQAGRLMRSKVVMDAGLELADPESIVGRSRAMQEVYKAIGRVAPTDATVLIRGESGTGKELIARAIYQHSLRSNKPFMVINCVAIPETLLESELFGYEKGAFTGAAHRRIGKIEQANGGTVFLDEIGDMPQSIQAKILRLLQEKSIERLGGGNSIPVDVRIIAATNRDLEQAISEGKFREDLYYRLKVVTLNLPPLRSRKKDIALLAKYFMNIHANQMGLKNTGLTSKAIKTLENYSWPGNVRELSNVIQRGLIFSRGCPISESDILRAISQKNKQEKNKIQKTISESDIPVWVMEALAQEGQDNLFQRLVDKFQALVIGEALKICNGNRSQTAKLLGLSRPTLLSKMEKLGIETKTVVKKN